MANFNINTVTLGGRVTSDVELKQTPNGVSICSFSIAVNRKTVKEGKRETDFINCTAWRNAAEFISKYFRKGSSICIVGSIQTRTWTDGNGNKRNATEVKVEDVYFVDSKSDEQERRKYISEAYTTPTEPNFEDLGEDDELPF